MFIRIEKASGVPISRQIADQVRAQVLAGTVESGHKMLSIRELARELAVNQNTVLRVYERLTAEGLLERRHGNGTYVRYRPGSARLKRQRKQFADEMAQLVRRGLMLGLDSEQLRSMLDEVARKQAAALPKARRRSERHVDGD